MEPDAPPSPAEATKAASRHLRGTLAEELQDGSDRFSSDGTVLLKFHGIYQQDDRDQRRARASARQDLAYSCMVRTSVPGGALTAAQYVALDDLADAVGGGAMRITTRQGIQYHFVHKADLRPLIGALNQHLVTTLAACGDVVRNVACCPAPLEGRDEGELLGAAQAIAERLRPRTRAYWELWVDGDRAVTAEEAPAAEEPFYGEHYLPRKFKIGLAWPGDNCIDVYTQDVGVVPSGDGAVLLVGGGLGMSHADDTTHPRLAEPLGWVPRAEVGDAVEAVVAVKRDHGNRADRHHARLKYLIEEQGIDWFRARVEEHLGHPLAPAPELAAWTGSDDHLGWHRQPDGRWFLGVPVPDGRLRDEGGIDLRRGVRAVVDRLAPGVRLTARQDLLLTDVDEADRGVVEELLREAGVPLADDLSPLRRQSMACPALPTCGQALGEAERVMPKALGIVQDALDRAGLGQLEVHVRMTGCPNGCARPYTAEIGLVGRTKTTYDVWVGGAQAGTRLARRLTTGVKLDGLGDVLDPVLARYRDERSADEALGDFCHRARIGEVLLGAG